jgi:hypothetical protein
LSAFKQLLLLEFDSEASHAALGGRHFLRRVKATALRTRASISKQALCQGIEKCLGFQHFLWRRTVRSGENGCATVSERLEMPAPTQAEFLLDKLLPSAKPGLPGFGYASGPLIEQQERT